MEEKKKKKIIFRNSQEWKTIWSGKISHHSFSSQVFHFCSLFVVVVQCSMLTIQQSSQKLHRKLKIAKSPSIISRTLTIVISSFVHSRAHTQRQCAREREFLHLYLFSRSAVQLPKVAVREYLNVTHNNNMRTNSDLTSVSQFLNEIIEDRTQFVLVYLWHSILLYINITENMFVENQRFNSPEFNYLSAVWFRCRITLSDNVGPNLNAHLNTHSGVNIKYSNLISSVRSSSQQVCGKREKKNGRFARQSDTQNS